MKYKVYQRKLMEIAGWACLIVALAIAVGFSRRIFFPSYDAEYALLLIFPAVLFLLSICEIYIGRRPRLYVDGEKLVCYPRWKRKFSCSISDISERSTRLRADYDGLIIGGAAGYAASLGRSGMYYDVTYRMKDGSVIRVETRMINAQILDNAVKGYLFPEEYPQDEITEE